MDEQAGIANSLTTFFGNVAENWMVWLTKGLIIIFVASLLAYAIRWSFKRSVAAYKRLAKTIPDMADFLSEGVPLIKTLIPYLLGTMIMNLGKAPGGPLLR